LQYGITENYRNLTNAQGKFLAAFRNINSFRNAIVNAGFLPSSEGGQTTERRRVSNSDKLTSLSLLSDISQNKELYEFRVKLISVF